MEVLFFTEFSKRKNSTKVPDDTSGVTKTVYLKGTTDKINPTFFLNGTEDYVYCKAWGMYYFVHRIGYDIDGAQIVYCNLDVLATFKTQILNTKAYIVYSSSGYNRWIRDDRTPIVARPPTISVSHSVPFHNGEVVFEASDDELVILNTVSQGTGQSHWIFTESKLDQLMDALTKAGSTVWGSLAEQFGDAIGSIISVTRLPINRLAVDQQGQLDDFYLGDYHVQTGEGQYMEAYRLTSQVLVIRDSCGIPTGYLDYRVFEPYSRLRMRLPFIGLVDISHQDFSSRVYYEIVIDYNTGKIVYTLYADDSYSKAIATYSGQCGSVVPITSQQITNAAAIVEGVGSALLSAAIPIGGISVGAGIVNIASAFYHSMDKTSNIVGSYSGGRAEYSCKRIEIILEQMKTAIEPDNLTEFEGRPVCMVDTISNYSGYIQTEKFSIDISALDVIKDMINTFMNNGVYLE
jgi:hypothetical protein